MHIKIALRETRRLSSHGFDYEGEFFQVAVGLCSSLTLCYFLCHLFRTFILYLAFCIR